MTTSDLLPIPVVQMSSTGSAFTTSTDVAAFFDKRHSHVLRAIESLLKDLREHVQWPEPEDADDEWAPEDDQPKSRMMVPEDLFQAADIEVNIGSGAVRRDPIYNLSRDGFALLAMGFTGKQALALKLAYISAFNEMEAKLRRPYVAPLAEDLEFAQGLRIRDKLMLHEQAYKASRALTIAVNDDERHQAYWQLYQVNTTLGIPMPTMEALGVASLSGRRSLPGRSNQSDG